MSREAQRTLDPKTVVRPEAHRAVHGLCPVAIAVSARHVAATKIGVVL